MSIVRQIGILLFDQISAFAVNLLQMRFFFAGNVALILKESHSCGKIEKRKGKGKIKDFL
ncbi:MAG: hypothetical protein MR630_00265 [Selenomonas sp.]|uniref:hypothetical protein n=1 Tax=Selenomonas sp. TaxID=2053611 RepID=UPI0025D92E4F|nr:hypothetical protein [Selenomonas sp.]MCI6231044.1 hypothetical protein [Selenomonas sp.]